MRKSFGSIVVLFSFGCGMLALVGCAPQTRFEWGTYQASLYDYYKSPDHRAQYEQALTAAVALGTKSGKVAPGLYAELGYMQWQDGDLTGAQNSFEKEIQLFPESKEFLTGVIQRMTANTAGKGTTS